MPAEGARTKPKHAAKWVLAAFAIAYGGLLVATAEGCFCDELTEFTLQATVVDGPTGQLLPQPIFAGVADDTQTTCMTTLGGAGGGGQNKGPCRVWRVAAPEKGGKITVTAIGYESESFDVPNKPDLGCGEGDVVQHTFRLKRKP